MEKIIATTMFLLTTIFAVAQEPFKGKYYNDEYKVYLQINFVEKDIVVPDQEVFGELDGYIGSTQCSTVWLITSAETKGKTATMEVVNNYGSEDFAATLKLQADGSLEYTHKGGSTLKFPVNRKWHKIPKKLVFVKQN